MSLAGNTFFADWEVSLMVFLQSHMGKLGAEIASYVSLFGEQLLAVVILGFLYWCYDKKFGEFVGINMLVGNVWNPMIKNLALRYRPYMVHKNIECLKPVEKGADIMDIEAQGYSFPSGHASSATTLYGSLPVYKNKSKWLYFIGIVIPILVGISRFCLGVHYPTDVICGWFLGLFTIALVTTLQKKIKNCWVLYSILFITCLPGLFYCQSNDYFTSLGLMLGFFIAIPFEKRYVRFENTKSFFHSLLRIIGGAGIYFGLNTLLKLPFSSDFLSSGTLLAHMIRTIRYTIVIFVDIAIYPMVFKYFTKKAKE